MHYPVKGRDGATIASAITSIDLHDIARTVKTYGAAGFYVVTPLKDQQVFAQKILDHWTCGAGAGYNPDRKKAFSAVSIKDDFNQVIREIQSAHNLSVRVVATSAAKGKNQVGYGELQKEIFAGDNAYVLALGTAWGLADNFMEEAYCRLKPVLTETGYNHLSVRSAAAIILDRLLGRYPGCL
jgi:hypothetical protein